jgi:DNA topoisomerase-1
VALRIICEREDEIEKFIPEEYWLIDVECHSSDGTRKYRLRADKYLGKPLSLHTEKEASRVVEEIEKSGLLVDEFRPRKAPDRRCLVQASTLHRRRREGAFHRAGPWRIAQSLNKALTSQEEARSD